MLSQRIAHTGILFGDPYPLALLIVSNAENMSRNSAPRGRRSNLQRKGCNVRSPMAASRVFVDALVTPIPDFRYFSVGEDWAVTRALAYEGLLRDAAANPRTLALNIVFGQLNSEYPAEFGVYDPPTSITDLRNMFTTQNN